MTQPATEDSAVTPVPSSEKRASLPAAQKGTASARSNLKLGYADFSPPEKQKMADMLKTKKTDHDLIEKFDGTFRGSVARLVEWELFEIVVVCVITVNALFLAMDTWETQDNCGTAGNTCSTLDVVLWAGNIVFTALFTIEMVLKLFVYGAFGKYGYFLNPWNRVDGFVVVTALLGLFIPGLKIFRSLRTTRLLVRSEAIQVVLHALGQAVPGISSVAIICAFIFVVFAILGVQLFKGKYWYCEDAEGSFVQYDKDVCDECAGCEWVHPAFGFDNIGISMLTLFEVAVGEGWAAILWAGIDTTEAEHAPVRNASPAASLFFVIFMFFGGFFAMNLFVGTLIDEFARLHGEMEGAVLMTPEQQDWIRATKLLMRTQLPSKALAPVNSLRKYCWRITKKPSFEYIITGFILLNTVVMACEHYRQTPAWDDALWIINLIFIIIFALEAVLKVISLGPTLYIRDNWNKFDAIIVIVSFVGLPLEGPGTSAVRVFRIGRMFRVIKKAKGLSMLFQTLLYSLPPLVNITILLIVVFFIFGVMGVNLFGRVRIEGNPALTANVNFRNLGAAVLTLYQLATTETWPNVMEGSMWKHEDCVDDCGTDWGLLYFILFMLIGSFVIFNLFITVVLENFDEANFSENEMFTPFEGFKNQWALLDPNATRTLPVNKFYVMLRILPPPLGLGIMAGDSDNRPVNSRLLELLTELQIPISDTMPPVVRYPDVITALARKSFGLNLEDAAPVAMFTPAPRPITDAFCTHHLLASERIATLHRKAVVSGRSNGQQERKATAAKQNDEYDTLPPGVAPDTSGGEARASPSQSPDKVGQSSQDEDA